MKCPRCKNTKRFEHYAHAELEVIVDYDKDGEVEDRDENLCISEGTTMMMCDRCKFICLPETFGNGTQWAKPHQDNINRWYIQTVIEASGITFRGKGYLDDKIGESYSQLYQIHTCSSLAELPQFLASEPPEIMNSALRKMEELQRETEGEC